jgi:hypothetical protein
MKSIIGGSMNNTFRHSHNGYANCSHCGQLINCTYGYAHTPSGNFYHVREGVNCHERAVQAGQEAEEATYHNVFFLREEV